MPIANYHKDKAVNAAIELLVAQGWKYEKKGNGHTVACLKCDTSTTVKHANNKCFIAVFGSPKNPTNHANKIMQQARNLTC